MQSDLDKIMPLMERAEKNAKTVLQQQKILTQVGTALRTINRQSSDLLEIAETVSSLKLQQNAAPAEISAAGQLVMLTQRIGKSANEFLTMEGVSPEAVFLLGKDLNSFKEIAQGLLEGSPELRLAGSKDAQTRERLAALLKLYEETRTQAGAILGNLQGLVSAREAQSVDHCRQRAAAPRTGRTCRASCPPQTGLGFGLFAALVAARARHPVRHRPRLRAAAGQPQAPGSAPSAAPRKPSARSRKPSASTTPTRPPFFA
jgi:twitching motility protein PilJ